jgi:hypothetical protein
MRFLLLSAVALSLVACSASQPVPALPELDLSAEGFQCRCDAVAPLVGAAFDVVAFVRRLDHGDASLTDVIVEFRSTPAQVKKAVADLKACAAPKGDAGAA